MDIWEKMYEEAQKLYNPHKVSDFVYANHVVAAVEAEAVVCSISVQNGWLSLICINSQDKPRLRKY